MKKIRISICIPVYNFGDFIGETLESIISQATDEVEIVVVDGASTDNTPDTVRRLQGRYENLNYYRLEKRGGIDRDMAKSVELAHGEYCWLFSGDDIMIMGALPDMLKQISQGYDVYLCESMLCRFDMTPIAELTMLNLKDDKVFNLQHDADRKEYFKKAMNTAAFFSFCSSLVLKKARWDAITPDEQFTGSCWAHAARLFKMIPDGLRVKYLSEPRLYKRCENDSFLDKGLVNRFKIAIAGYDKIADVFFGRGSREAFHIRRTLRTEHKLRNLLRAKLLCHEQAVHEDRKTLDQLASILYSDRSPADYLRLFAYNYTPTAVLKIIRPVYIKLQSLLIK